jgi:plasmid maintenance system killer protein
LAANHPIARIKGSWRITFQFEGGEFIDVKVEDYH